MSSPKAFEGDRGQRVYYASSAPPKFTTDNYRDGAVFGRHRPLLHELADRHHSRDDHPDPDRRLRRLCAGLDAVSRPGAADRGHHRPAGRAAADVADPAAETLQRRRRRSSACPSKTYLGIWLAHTGFGLPFAIYLLRSYMAGLPREIMESARIDGASDFEIFVKIVLPLSFPVLASFAIFQFLWVWNDLLVAMVFLGTEADQIVLTGQAQRAARLARRQLGDPDDLGLRHHHRAADRLLLAAALLRARPAGRLGEGRLRSCRRRLRKERHDPGAPATAAGPRLVARRGDLPDLSALASRTRNGDGIGDLDGHHRSGCRLHRGARRRRDLDLALLQVADEGFRLRRHRLPRRRSDVRHARRFRRAGRARRTRSASG